MRGGVLCALLALACAQETRPDAPAAAFPDRRHDFGQVVQGTRIEHAFPLENRGGADLVVEQVDAPAAITVVGFDRVVPPGGRGAIRLALDTTGLQGTGELRARVHNNDPQAPRAVVAFSGRIVRELAFEPRDRLYFFTVRGDAREERVTLVNHGRRPVSVREAVSDNSRFRPHLEPLAGGRRWAVAVALDPATPAGRHQGTVTVRSDHPEIPELALPVRAKVEEVVTARPATVQFGQVRTADLGQRGVARQQVLVLRHRGEGFRVTEARTDVPFVEVEVAPKDAGKSYLISLTLRENAARGELRGTLTVRTNDPDLPRIAVPIRGTIY